MTVDRSRGVDRQALSSTTNRIKKDGIPPGGLDTLTPERWKERHLCLVWQYTRRTGFKCVCTCVLYFSEDGDIRTNMSSQGWEDERNE